MSVLKIPCLKELIHDRPEIIAERLKISGAAIVIDKINWKDFPYRPEVKVFVGYCDFRLWIHYVVYNDFVRAKCRIDQEPVWQDSCVEFFMKQGNIYRNFEFNSLGVCLSGTGSDRNLRERLDDEFMDQIMRFPCLSVETLPVESVPTDWTLTVAIPLDLIGQTAGSEFIANFYKCGDKTKVPHYLSWKAIATATPDFHQPDYFAPVKLVR